MAVFCFSKFFPKEENRNRVAYLSRGNPADEAKNFSENSVQGLGKDLKEFEMQDTNEKWKHKKAGNARKLGVQFAKTMMFEDARSKSSFNSDAGNDAT